MVAQGLTESGVNVTTLRSPSVSKTVEVVFSLSEPKSRTKPGARCGGVAPLTQLAGSNGGGHGPSAPALPGVRSRMSVERVPEAECGDGVRPSGRRR